MAFEALYEWLFGKAISVPPHQKYPEILHWQRGDEFELQWGDRYSLISVGENGIAYVRE